MSEKITDFCPTCGFNVEWYLEGETKWMGRNLTYIHTINDFYGVQQVHKMRILQ